MLFFLILIYGFLIFFSGLGGMGLATKPQIERLEWEIFYFSVVGTYVISLIAFFIDTKFGKKLMLISPVIYGAYCLYGLIYILMRNIVDFLKIGSTTDFFVFLYLMPLVAVPAFLIISLIENEPMKKLYVKLVLRFSLIISIILFFYIWFTGSVDVSFEAIDNNRTSEVKRAISHGLDINKKDGVGFTLLMRAIDKGSEDIAELLINNKADINTKANGGFTALQYAAKCNLLKIARMLIENGAEVNAVDEYGTTALMWAARYSSKDLVVLLIDNGAEINAVDQRGRTPLKWAIEGGKEEIASLLQERGANR